MENAPEYKGLQEKSNPFAGLEVMAAAVHAVNKANGFWAEGEERNISEALMLVRSELEEALETRINWRIYVMPADLEYMENACENSDVFPAAPYEDFIKDRFEYELTDALFRILDLIAGLEIPAERIAALVLKANAARGYKHGKAY